ncbi:MAG: FAD-binding oxidoreductase [Myxococcales bacterium]|nr:FAD-binding oxidoreductase [Myxococcales bacterium]
MITPDAVARTARALAAEGRRPWPVRGDSSKVPEGCETIDYTGLSQIRAVDVTAGVIWAEAGATWAEVEAALAPRAMTLGPLPAWLRDRMVVESLAEDDRLRPSPRYGQLTEGVLALRAALPGGQLTQASVSPRRATGPDLMRTVVGARHRAGLVTDVHLQAWPRPAAGAFVAAAFDAFADAFAGGVAALRAGVRPAAWQVARDRGDVVLAAWIVDEPGLDEAVARFQAAAGGRPSRATGGLADALAPDAEPYELLALRAGDRAAAAAFAEATRGARVLDLRPEGATVYARRGRPEHSSDWAALADAVHAALEEA